MNSFRKVVIAGLCLPLLLAAGATSVSAEGSRKLHGSGLGVAIGGVLATAAIVGIAISDDSES